MRVLVVEDDKKIASFVVNGLKQSGYAVDHANDGEQGLIQAQTISYDAAIVDLMLPKLDGLKLIQQLRSGGVRIPVLILSAKASVDDRVRGLQAGGDDYLTKPFAFSELLARMHSILRRAHQQPADSLQVEDLHIDLLSDRAVRGGKTLDLTPKEFALLALLTRHRGEILSRRQIARQIWDMDTPGDSNVVDVHVRRLRSKADDPFPRKLIHTVRGAGYVLEARS